MTVNLDQSSRPESAVAPLGHCAMHKQHAYGDQERHIATSSVQFSTTSGQGMYYTSRTSVPGRQASHTEPVRLSQQSKPTETDR